MDILLVPRLWRKYKYFHYLHKNLTLKTKVKSLLPQLRLSFNAPKLSKQEIKEGVYFHLQRKKVKYSYADSICQLLRIYYELKYRLYYRQFYYLLNRSKPKCVVVWNGHMLPEMAVKKAAEKLGIIICFFEVGLLPNTVTVDPKGINNFNSVPRKESFYRNYQPFEKKSSTADRQLVVRQFNRRKIAHARQQDFHLALPKKFIFVPFQVRFDSQIILSSPNICSMYDLYRWIEFTLENSEDENLFFVVKEHPSDPYKYDTLYKKNPRILFSNRNTQELIEGADAIITINSSVGLESLIFHRPVIALGDACYNIEGITQTVSSKEQLVSAINRLPNWRIDESLVENFLSYLKNDYCISGSWNQPHKDHVKHIERRLSDLIGERV